MQLTINSGPTDGTTVDVTGRHFVVGRAEGCDLVLADPTVSRRHASLEPLPDGRMTLNDLDSTSGTWVDGRRIASAVLSGGEELRFGNAVARVMRAGSTPPSGTPVPAAGRRDGSTPPSGTPVPPQEGGSRQSTPPSGTPVPPPAAPPPAPAPPAAAPPYAAPAPGGPPGARARSESAIQRIMLQRSIRTATVVGILVGVLVLAAGVLFGTGVLPLGGDDEVTAADVIERIAPSTVFVVSDNGDGSGGRGTGWVFDAEEGLIVTNAHVVEGGASYSVAVGDQLTIEEGGEGFVAGEDALSARVLGSALCEDLAVLKVADSDELQTLPLLPSQDDLRIGEAVVAVGYPANLAGDRQADLTGTAGVVSIPETTFPAVPLPGGGQTGPYSNVVQTDAVVNEGNSGGPLVTLDGQLVGVNSTVRRDVPGQNFAIGVDRVRRVVPRLRRGADVC